MKKTFVLNISKYLCVMAMIILGGTSAIQVVDAQGGNNAGSDTDAKKFSIELKREDLTGYASDEGRVLNTVIQAVFVIGAVVALAFLLTGAIGWITAGGDTAKTTAARNRITGAVIGLLIIGASFAILQFVLYILGYNDLNFIDIDPIS